MAKPFHPELTGACGCRTPWIAGLGACCAKRLELVEDFNQDLELTQKPETDATYGDTTYGVQHTPPPVSIRREYIVLGDKSPPLEAPDSPPESRGTVQSARARWLPSLARAFLADDPLTAATVGAGSRRLFVDQTGADGILRQEMDVFQLELQRKLELQLVCLRVAHPHARFRADGSQARTACLSKPLRRSSISAAVLLSAALARPGA
jgi:hypothetical protein